LRYRVTGPELLERPLVGFAGNKIVANVEIRKNEPVHFDCSCKRFDFPNENGARVQMVGTSDEDRSFRNWETICVHSNTL